MRLESADLKTKEQRRKPPGLLSAMLDRAKERLAGRLAEKAVARGYEDIPPEHEPLIAAARTDIRAFIEYCFKAEDGTPIVLAPHQLRWLELWDKYPRLVHRAPPEFSKTKLRLWRRLWKLGHNPNLCGAMISERAESQAWKWLAEIREHVDSNIRLHRVFPGLVRGRQWTVRALTIERTIKTGESTIVATGLYGAVNSSRWDFCDLDDVLSFENTHSEFQREKLREWVDMVVLNRMLPGSEVCFLSHPWSNNDLGNELAKRPGFYQIRESALEGGTIEEINNPRPDTHKRLLWPSRWPLARLQEKARKVGSRPFRRAFLMDDGTDSKHCPEAWIQKALVAGIGLRLLDEYHPVRGEKLIVGVDLASGEDRRRHDSTEFSGWLVSGPKKRLLCAASDRRERWDPAKRLATVGEFADNFVSTDGRPPTFAVESNLGQKHFADNMRLTYGQRIIVIDVYTTAEKRHPQLGVEGLFLDMERGNLILSAVWSVDEKGHRVAVPADEHTAAFCQACRDYDPADRHIPDPLAAAWLAIGRQMVPGQAGRAGR